jgi:hypothetical protein
MQTRADNVVVNLSWNNYEILINSQDIQAESLVSHFTEKSYSPTCQVDNFR